MEKENESIIQSAERQVKFRAMDFRKYVGEALANELLDELSLRWAAEKALDDIHRAASDKLTVRYFNTKNLRGKDKT